MDKKAIFNHYSAIIDDLIDHSVFFSVYFQAPWHLDTDLVDNEILPLNVDLRTGATRACLIDNAYDWVVKMDVEDEPEYGSACMREIHIYNDAKEQGLEKYFAPVVYLGNYTRTIFCYDIEDIAAQIVIDYSTVDGFIEDLEQVEENLTLKSITISLPLFAYMRADSYQCADASDWEQKRARTVVSPLLERNIVVATSFIKDYGMSAYKEFSKFALKEHINDIHMGNIGTIDGTICLIDYSGYHDDGIYDEDEDEEEETT